jgi:hypothetical protein
MRRWCGARPHDTFAGAQRHAGTLEAAKSRSHCRRVVAGSSPADAPHHEVEVQRLVRAECVPSASAERRPLPLWLQLRRPAQLRARVAPGRRAVGRIRALLAAERLPFADAVRRRRVAWVIEAVGLGGRLRRRGSDPAASLGEQRASQQTTDGEMGGPRGGRGIESTPHTGSARPAVSSASASDEPACAISFSAFCAASFLACASIFATARTDAPPPIPRRLRRRGSIHQHLGQQRASQQAVDIQRAARRSSRDREPATHGVIE